MNWINSRLSFPARLSLLAALFLIPIGLLTTLYLSSSLANLSFSQKELAGSAYLSSIWRAVAQDAPAPPLDGRFKEAEARSRFVAAGAKARLQAGVDYIAAVEDGSNLTLDTDLDSFYAQDALAVRLPVLLKAVEEVRSAVRSGQPGDLLLAHDHLNAAQGQADGSLRSAIKNNASGVVRPLLATVPDDLAKATQALAAASGPGDTARAATVLAEQIDAAWRADHAALDRLLQARIAREQTEIAINMGVVAAALLAVGVLSFAVSQGLTRRVGGLVQAMTRLSEGETAVSIPCTADRNETGKIAGALERFKAALVERERLRAESARIHEDNARQLADVRAAFEDASRHQLEALHALQAALAALAQGDLVQRIRTPLAADYEPLRADFNAAIAKLQAAMIDVAAKTNAIDAGAGEISGAADDLSRRTEQQAASLEQTAAALDQITATVRKTADGSAAARAAADAAEAVAAQSAQVVTRAVQAMGRIEGSSREIGQIIGVIDEIAFQTNLLALNAGVEAARAGDAGRGFAVVASEVRALAQRSATAAKEIKTLIRTSESQVGDGVRLVGETGDSLARIAAHITAINSVVVEIAASCQEQAAGLAEVNTAVNQMDQAVQQNAAMVEQSTAAVRGLGEETGELLALVARFEVEGAGAPADQRLAGSSRLGAARASGSVVSLQPRARAAART